MKRRIVDTVDPLQPDLARAVLEADHHQRLAEMIEIAGDELDGLARLLDRLLPGRRFLGGLALGFLFGALLLGDLRLDLAARVFLELPSGRFGLGLEIGLRLGVLLGLRSGLLIGLRFGFLLGLLGAQPVGFLRRRAPRLLGGFGCGARLHHFRVGTARGHRIVAAAPARQQQDGRDTGPQAGARLGCWRRRQGRRCRRRRRS